jgi:hypothetical protein
VRAPRAYVPQAELLCANRYSFHVVVIVPCYFEPLELVRLTVLAAAAAALPPGCSREIWLCDDGVVGVFVCLCVWGGAIDCVFVSALCVCCVCVCVCMTPLKG